MSPVDVYLERGRTRTFASALSWPGWSRSAPATAGEEGALDALLSYADRYSLVAARAGARFPAQPQLRVVERVPGTGTTDFGAPDVPASVDSVPLTRAVRDNQVDLLVAAWAVLDDVVAGAPEQLRKGPRGGGRDRDEVLRHVVEAERAYARKVGVRHRPFAVGDVAARDALRADLVATLRPAATGASWMPAYFLRRAAWHVLDHAWEIEDKS